MKCVIMLYRIYKKTGIFVPFFGLFRSDVDQNLECRKFEIRYLQTRTVEQMGIELRLAGLAPIFLDHLLYFMFPPDVRWLVGVHLQPLPPAHVEGRLPDQRPHGPPGHHHPVHERRGQGHLSNLSGQFDSQETISQRMNKYDQTNVVDGGDEVAQGEIVSILNTLQPGEDNPLVPGPTLALTSSNLSPGGGVLLQLQGQRGGSSSSGSGSVTVR